MALHRLTQIVMGVPNLEQTAAYYAEFGLTRGENGTFTTVDGGEQLRIVPAASRRLVRLGVGADDPDDLDRVAASRLLTQRLFEVLDFFVNGRQFANRTWRGRGRIGFTSRSALRVAGSCCVGAPEGCRGRRRAQVVLCSRPVGRISRDG